MGSSPEFRVRCRCGQEFGRDRGRTKHTSPAKGGDRTVLHARCGNRPTGHPYKKENVILERISEGWLLKFVQLLQRCVKYILSLII